MRKFIHSDFQIDLSKLKMTDNAENPWFSGNYFAKYSYPFTLPLTDELDIAFGFLSNYNSANKKTLFEGIYVHNNIMEKAVLEIEESEKELSASVRYGLEDFPNFVKKLAELPLIKVPVTDIYIHAAGIIAQSWPAVNYNFPQIHIDKIETEDSDTWAAFEKIINNYRAGAFLRNTVDTEEDITYNRNIIQPLPYLLYVLKTGFLDAGYELKGDILQDQDLKETLIYADVEYFLNETQESIQITVPSTDYDAIANVDDGRSMSYDHIFDIAHPGKYRIVGSVFVRTKDTHYGRVEIYYRNTRIYNWANVRFKDFVVLNVDVVFETLADFQDDYLRLTYFAGYNEEDIIFDLSVNPIRLHDESGEAIPTIRNENKVDLIRAVPDMLFGDLVKFVLSAKLMDITTDIVTKEVWVNYINKQIYDSEINDLSLKQVKYPKITFTKGASWLLQYQDVNSEEYKFTAVFQNADGFSTVDINKDEKTIEIVLNALPLPLLFRNGVQSAHGFDNDKNKPYLVTYKGLQGGVNLSVSSDRWLIPNLYQESYAQWLTSRINAESFTWTFLAYYEEIMNLTAKSRVHAYGKIHQVKTLQKTEVSPDLFEVEIVTELLQ
ncbi:hypothetical protein ACX0HA_09065 [Flavobacterium hauense]